MILDTVGTNAQVLSITAEEAFELQQQLGELLRFYVVTNGMAGGKTLNVPLTLVRDKQLIHSSLTICIDNSQGR